MRRQEGPCRVHVPAGRVIEGTTGLRNVVAVSRLVPHGSSIIVPRDQSSQAPPPFPSAVQPDGLLGVQFISVASLKWLRGDKRRGGTNDAR